MTTICIDFQVFETHHVGERRPSVSEADSPLSITIKDKYDSPRKSRGGYVESMPTQWERATGVLAGLGSYSQYHVQHMGV